MKAAKFRQNSAALLVTLYTTMQCDDGRGSEANGLREKERILRDHIEVVHQKANIKSTEKSL